MGQTSDHNATSLASHSCTFRSLLAGFLLIISCLSTTAQGVVPVNSIDTIPKIEQAATSLTPQQVRSRVRLITIANAAAYSGIMIGLNAAWYSKYDRSKFHTFNDNAE